MDFQTAFNLVFGAFSTLLGAVMMAIYQNMKELTKADESLVNKVNSIEVLVAGNYVKRSEFDTKVDAVFKKLDTIEEKLDRRLDNLHGKG